MTGSGRGLLTARERLAPDRDATASGARHPHRTAPGAFVPDSGRATHDQQPGPADPAVRP